MASLATPFWKPARWPDQPNGGAGSFRIPAVSYDFTVSDEVRSPPGRATGEQRAARSLPTVALNHALPARARLGV
jgi:hypothetical protein